MNAPSTLPNFPGATDLDEEMLDQLRDLGLLEEIVRAYVDQLPTQIRELRGAIDSHDPVATMRIAHALKGVSVSIGAKGVAERCAHIEKIARSGTLEGVHEVMTSIEQNLESVKKAFNQVCA
jgi:HPt (histidine-containing phosphotransfer) domain-containing protein